MTKPPKDCRKRTPMGVCGYLLVIGFTLALVGCQTRLAGDYPGPKMVKYPVRLHLDGDGSYSFEGAFSLNGGQEKGRWWRVRDDVVLLVPDDTGKVHWFAQVTKQPDPLRGQLRYSTDAREILNGATSLRRIK